MLLGSMSAFAATVVPVLWTGGGLDAGTTGAGQAARITSDYLGNVAVVSGPAGGREMAVTSYTAGGNLRWRRSVSPASGTFQGDWIVAAPDGDLLAVGHNVTSSGRPIAITLVRYATDGTLRWRVDIARTLPSVGRLVVDGVGDAYLVFNSLGDGQDIQLHKYNGSGVLVWAQTLATTPGANDTASSLALSPDGAEVVLTGSVSGGATWITASYNALTGTRRWLVTAAEGVAALDVVLDGSNAYVTGQGNVGTTGYLSVIAYDRASGLRRWRTDKKPTDATSAAGLRMALAQDGSVIVTGQAARGFLDWYTVAFQSTGVARWEAVRDGGLSTDEIPAAVLAVSDGTTVVTGRGGPPLPGGYIQGVAAGYDANGALLWEAFAAQATVWGVALPNNDVCATGGYDALVTCWRPRPPSPPSAPSGLAATLATGAISLTWQDNSDDESSFTVERSEFTPNGWTGFVPIATLATNVTSYSDSLYTSTSYEYRVRASNSAGNSAYSNTASISVLSGNAPPAAVILAAPTSGTAPLNVIFDGSHSSDLDGSVVRWTWTFGDGTSGTGVATSHVYPAPGTYTVTLRVTDNLGLSSFATATTIAVTAPQPPSAPSVLTATAQSKSSIRLQWTNTTADQTEVTIERCQAAGCSNFAQIATVAGTATTYTNTGLSSRTNYTYRVRSRNAAGYSPYSNSASATTPKK